MKERELGMVAELEFKKRAMQNGFVVSKTVNDRNGYDFIVDCGDRLTKIQVKSKLNPDKTRRTSSYAINASKGVKNITTYDKNDFDFLVVYLHLENLLYIIPMEEVSKRIRLSPYSKVSKYNKYIDAWHLIKL